MELAGAVIVGQLQCSRSTAAPRFRLRAHQGTIAGRWSTSQLLSTLAAIPEEGGFLCGTDPSAYNAYLYSVFKGVVCLAADITPDPTKDNKGRSPVRCDLRRNAVHGGACAAGGRLERAASARGLSARRTAQCMERPVSALATSPRPLGERSDAMASPRRLRNGPETFRQPSWWSGRAANRTQLESVVPDPIEPSLQHA